MSLGNLNAGMVMDDSAAYLNDAGKSVYTYVKQLPYLKLALKELEEEFQRNSVPVTQRRMSGYIELEAGDTTIKFNNGIKSLPNDLIEPITLWERNHGVDPFVQMTHKDFLSLDWEGVEISQFLYWSWNGNEIRVPSSNQDNDIKIDYIASLFTQVVDESSPINVISAQAYLGKKTAAYCARYIMENPTRADSLDMEALVAMNRAFGISSKGKQNISTRRRPFRSGYRGRYFT